MLHTGRVLVVSDETAVSDFWMASLELDGYDTESCPGPSAAQDCPRLHGVRCALRERADIAVVDLDCEDDALACTKVPDDGGTVFVRRSSAPTVGREDLVRAVEDAQRHVEMLHGAEVDRRMLRAVDLD